jgi:transcriptional regulator with XRE-family HTH domain
MKQPEIGQKIAELRKQHGFTQEDLAYKSNLNVRSV